MQLAALLQTGRERNTFLLLSGLLIVLTLLAYYRYRQLSRQYRIAYIQKENLYSLNQTKDQLLQIIAHDLRSYIHAVKANLSQLQNTLVGQYLPEVILLAESAVTTCKSAQALLDNLLYWSLSQTGQLYFDPQTLRASSIIGQVYYDFIPLAAARNIQLVNTIPDNIWFNGDINSVKIIFRNLLDNAIKYTPAGQSVTVSAEQVGQECLITVTDTGPGISQQVINALYNPVDGLQQKRSGTQGTGLGLRLARSMSERNGGKLVITSEVDHGTSIAIHLPAANKEG